MVAKKKATKKNICSNPKACHDVDCYDCGCRPFPRGKPKKKTASKTLGKYGGIKFQNPGSALRKSSKSNPRIYPCPTCKKENRLTAQDKAKGYQCDDCANRSEGGCY